MNGDEGKNVCVCVCVWGGGVNNGWVGIGTLTKRKQGQHKLH